MAGTATLPVVFNPLLSDAFELPKMIAMLTISAAIIAGLLATVRSQGLRAISRPSGSTDALVAYLVLTTAATIHSPDQRISLLGQPFQYQGLIATFAYAFAFLGARAGLSTEDRIQRLFVVAVSAAVLVAAYGLLQQQRLDPVWHALDKGRIFSTLGQANALAAYLVLALPLAIALALMAGGLLRVAALLGVTVICIAVLATLSRGGYLAGIVALAVMGGLLLRRSSLTTRRATMAAAAVVVFVSVAVVSPPISQSIGRIVERAAQAADPFEGSAATHLDLWAVGTRIVLDHPLLGVGPEIYPSLFADYRDRVLPSARALVLARFTPESPHSVPLAIAVGAGLPALAAYSFLVLGTVVLGLRRVRNSRRVQRLFYSGLIAAIVGHFVSDLFMTADVAGTWMMWALLGALAAKLGLGHPSASVSGVAHG